MASMTSTPGTSLGGRNVLVTGAGGFIGSHLTERLAAEGANVRAMVRYSSSGSRGWLERSPHAAGIDFRYGDISDRDFVRKAMDGCDVVFHLAALIGIPYSYVSPDAYVRTNIVGTMNVLEAARQLGTGRVLITSTSEVYGTALTAPISEEHPKQPQSPYSATKIAADCMAESFWRSFDLPVGIVRPFNTFGPRQSARAVIPTIISQCLAGAEEIRLGNLSPTRDLNYVDNTVDGFLAAADGDAAMGQALNFGFGQEISIGDLAERIVSLTGSNARIVSEEQRLRPDRSEVERLLADNTKAREATGWEPRVGLDEGLTRTIEWMREHLGAYRVGEYMV